MKHYRTPLLILSLFLAMSGVFAQQPGHSIKVRMKGIQEGKTCHLAHFFGYNQYIKVDSAKVENGLLNFEGKDPLKGGIYLIVLSPSKYYDFAVDGKEQFMEIESDTTDFVGHVKFKGSKENDLLFAYRKFLQDKSKEAETVSAAAKGKTDAASQEASRKQMEKIQADVETYMKEFTKTHEGTFAAKVIKGNMEPELPKVLPKKANGRPDSTYLFNYYKGHFFDNIDFADDRLLRSPFLHSRVERYFKDLVYQVTDSINRDADKVLKLAKPNQEVYRFVLWQITNKYENNEIVGLDGVFVHLAENYYLKNAPWLDSTQRAKFKERVDILKPLQTGLVFPQLIVSDSLGKEHSPMQSKTKYTIVHFYDPECGHCKDSAPKLMEYYHANKDKVTIYNVSIVYDKKKIMNFVNTYKTGELLNLWDAKGRYYFRNNFDVYSTPTNYILDKDKKIIARRIPVEKLQDFITFYERQQIQKMTNETK
ncbi:TlpA family protein disulfide reductase [Emticicia agri]|uniref:TlpA family protein disulfide reductase n=1 Tax=Emticicia agri TaxID=2492393 RepID=UPI0013EBFAE2|nr:TlpA family protein disulfide reductase [Emticicia agri]